MPALPRGTPDVLPERLPTPGPATEVPNTCTPLKFEPVSGVPTCTTPGPSAVVVLRPENNGPAGEVVTVGPLTVVSLGVVLLPGFTVPGWAGPAFDCGTFVTAGGVPAGAAPRGDTELKPP